LNTKFTDLYYYILGNHSAIDVAVKRALNEKKSFNEKEMIRKWDDSANSFLVPDTLTSV
jgi:hypothetical protein